MNGTATTNRGPLNVAFGISQFGMDDHILMGSLTDYDPTANGSSQGQPLPFAEIDVSQDKASGGYDLNLYGYH